MSTVSQQQEMMTFEEFREAVGASYGATRDALRSLELKPDPAFGDARRKLYRREWVERVRAEVERMRQ